MGRVQSVSIGVQELSAAQTRPKSDQGVTDDAEDAPVGSTHKLHIVRNALDLLAHQLVGCTPWSLVLGNHLGGDVDRVLHDQRDHRGGAGSRRGSSSTASV